MQERKLTPNIATASMPIILDQPFDSSSPTHLPSRLNEVSSCQSSMCEPRAVILQDYSDMCKTLETTQGQLLDCRVQNKQSKIVSADVIDKTERDNWLLFPKDRDSLIISEPGSLLVEQTYFHKRLVNQDQFMKINKPNRKRTRPKKDVNCYKCQFCPMMTLSRDMMLRHGERKGACAADVAMLRCPGCSNVFFSTASLRVHLTHDHNMVVKDVKAILMHLPRVKVLENFF